jgi:glycolate oxidase
MKAAHQLDNSFISTLRGIVGNDYASTDQELLTRCASDETEDHIFMPDIVVRPANTDEVSRVLKLCNEHQIPVTPRGGGTGLSGGALPVKAGVVLLMDRFNRIINIDEANLQATVEPGVITEVFQETVKEKGLFYPPDPSSRGTCFLGGNLAENAGGPKAVKYGVTRDYVLNLEVVLPNGEIIWTAANVLKNSTGYNITQLMCGSEGTLGVITQIVFKLRPYPKRDVTMLVPFTTAEEACKAITAIYMTGVSPSGMEYIDRDSMTYTARYLEQMGTPVTIALPDHINAQLLIELDGNDEEVLMKDAETIMSTLEDFDTGELYFADTAQQKEELWRLRRNVSPAVNAYTLTKAEDVVVPRSQLPALVVAIKEIGAKYNFNSVCFGHAGDGNLHINVMREELSEAYWNNEINQGIEEIFKKVVDLGGTLSGEHGIGIAKRPYMHLAMKEANLELMRGIKKAFDPKGILNPDKIF